MSALLPLQPLQLTMSTLSPKRKEVSFVLDSECLEPLSFLHHWRWAKESTGSHQWGGSFWPVGTEGAPFLPFSGLDGGGAWVLSNCSGDTPEAEINICLFLTIGLGTIQ